MDVVGKFWRGQDTVVSHKNMVVQLHYSFQSSNEAIITYHAVQSCAVPQESRKMMLTVLCGLRASDILEKDPCQRHRLPRIDSLQGKEDSGRAKAELRVFLSY